MSHTSQENEKLLSLMTLAEKARILQRIVRDFGGAFSGIGSNPGVCGGEPCIVRTRIPVWLLGRAGGPGVSESELFRCYQTLRAEDLSGAWACFRCLREEIGRQISENEED